VFYFYSSQKEEKKPAEQNVLVRRDSNPANCNDIEMIGYTLNGYYLVNSSDSAGRLGVSFCQFKLPPGAVRCKDMLHIKIREILLYDGLYTAAKEEIFGFINLKENINKTSAETKSRLRIH